MLLFAAVSAQTVTLTFTGRDASNQYVPLNRVVVSNLTRGWQDTLFWPDTVLVMTDQTGIDDFVTDGFHLSQNNPNPFNGTTYVNLNVTEPGEVSLVITDITGRNVETLRATSLHPGIYKICITLSSSGIYFLTARQNGQTSSVKMVNRGNGSGDAIAFTGTVGANHYSSLLQPKNATKGFTNNTFVAGDQMQYVGFATLNGALEESGHVIQGQYVSQGITLSFAVAVGDGDNQPCPGTPIVTDYDGNSYNTMQIGQQCWIRENLRTTHYADGTAIQSGGPSPSGTYPYYYDYSTSDIPLVERGYLYNWPAVMHGSVSSNAIPSGVQGICPTGWHLPSDQEWYQLTNYLSGQNAYICGDNSSYIAKALASETEWNTYNGVCYPGDQSTYANNSSGFGAVPAGFWNDGFYDTGRYSSFWSSTENEHEQGDTWCRYLNNHNATVFKVSSPRYYGKSVRCLRD